MPHNPLGTNEGNHMRQDTEFVRPDDWTMGHKVLYDLGFLGRYLHYAAGGRSGQKRIITSLACSDGHMAQRDLQEHLGITSGAISEVLAKVEADGLVERARSKEDGRQQEVRLTERGLELARTYAKERDRFEGECLACLTENEQDQLLGLLDHLVDHWKQVAQDAGAANGREARA